MYIQFAVKFPEKNWTQDPAAFDALRQILPPPSLINVPPATAVSEPVDLEDTDAHSRGFANDGDAMDEDEDGHPQAERVQCASQ
jgi:DnaJ family protein A protein 2